MRGSSPRALSPSTYVDFGKVCVLDGHGGKRADEHTTQYRSDDDKHLYLHPQELRGRNCAEAVHAKPVSFSSGGEVSVYGEQRTRAWQLWTRHCLHAYTERHSGNKVSALVGFGACVAVS